MAEKTLIRAAERLGYQRGFIEGRIKGFDEGFSFNRRETTARIEGLKDVMIDDFLKARYDLDQEGKRQASDLYQEFSKWWISTGRGVVVPSSTNFGKRLSRRLRKTKINGCIWYHGLRSRE
jgi:hypothetical protein